LPPVCQELQPFALTGGSQVSNLPGTGSYSGASGVINDSAFSPQLAGPGTFPIIYTFTSSNGCFDTAMQSITVYPTPLVDYGGVQSVLEGDSITLNPVSVSGIGLQYLWVPSIYLNTDTSATPLTKPADDATYTITVTSLPAGCHASTTLLVQVLKDFQVPNTFTPNNDGINDTWVIQNLPKYPIQWVQVFDRYGQLLYESHGYSTPWDGTYKGKQLPSGTYYYIIELNGLRSPKTGYVTILR
jgi:gliding motility-associated-like protein